MTSTAGNTPWIYVKVRNRGCSTLTGKVEVFWANASTAFTWGGPTSITDQCYPVNSTMPTISLGPGEEGVVAVQWQNMVLGTPGVGNPVNTGVSHFCFVARFESTTPTDDPGYYEDISQGPYSVYNSAINSNNFIWRNVTLVNTDNSPAKPLGLLVGNYSNTNIVASIKFIVPKSEVNPFLNEGGIKVNLGQDVYQKWISGGRLGTGIVDSGWVDRHLLPTGGAHFHQGPGTNEPYTIRIVADSASLENLAFDTSDVRLIKTTFNYFNVLSDKPLFNYDIVQYNLDPGTGSEMLTGGERYEITYPTCFTISAGSDQTVTPRCPTTLEVEPVLAGVKYIWRNNADGSFVDSASTIIIAPNESITYEVEAIAPNGCIAYAWVSIDTASGRCASLREFSFLDKEADAETFSEFRAYPNPFTDFITIEYMLPEKIETAEVFITDAIGRRVFATKLTLSQNKETINPTGLSPGVFICNIILSDGTKKQYKLIYVK